MSKSIIEIGNPAEIYIGKQLHRFIEQILGRKLYPDSNSILKLKKTKNKYQ